MALRYAPKKNVYCAEQSVPDVFFFLEVSTQQSSTASGSCYQEIRYRNLCLSLHVLGLCK